jgi:tRNA(adenine34) deaminase
MKWHELALPWQVAFSEAWNAFCNGAFPVGAAVVNSSGLIVASGRNTVRGSKPSDGSLHGNKLGHAEINALLRISEHQHTDYQHFTLYTTMEPCPLCFGALVMSKLRRCVYASRDSIAGCASLAQATPYLEQRKLLFVGPDAHLEIFQVALLVAFMLLHRVDEAPKFAAAWTRHCPEGVELGKNPSLGGILSGAKGGNLPASHVFNQLTSFICHVKREIKL